MTLAIRSLWPACGPACGRSATLRDDIVRRTHTQAGRYRVLGYTDRMADLMRVANLFVGKPGGLSSSECMAAGLPMVLVDPIPARRSARRLPARGGGGDPLQLRDREHLGDRHPDHQEHHGSLDVRGIAPGRGPTWRTCLVVRSAGGDRYSPR